MKRHDAIRSKLKAFGLAYPEAHSKSPWPEHDDLAVRDKTFAFLNAAGLPLRITCKLPLTGQMALTLPFAIPTGYGLGKSGWVTATFTLKDTPPLDLLKDWIDESYRAQAPKKLVATLPDDPRRQAAARQRTPKRR
jgi:predicted DNA-binding protein (MmcQ/YjbR family)